MFINKVIIPGSAIVLAALAAIMQITGMQKNNPPQVHITLPQHSGLYSWNTVIPYAVVVSDKEDGESTFGEIPPTEIFVELHYFADPAKASLFMKDPAQKEPAGYTLLKKQDCFTCHAVHSKLIGPSFSEVSARYKRSPDMAAIASHVIKGSTGRWGTAVMPTHPELTEKEAQQIVSWILTNAGDTSVDYFRGAEGSFRLQPLPHATANGMFVLKATYTDHGIGDAGNFLTGQDMISFGIRKN